MSEVIESLACRKSDFTDDWYVIERAVHDGRQWLEHVPGGLSLQCSSRFSDADIEGTMEEMQAIARAIIERGKAHFKRCSVDACASSTVFFSSPRNSTRNGEATLEAADALAAEILSMKASL